MWEIQLRRTLAFHNLRRLQQSVILVQRLRWALPVVCHQLNLMLYEDFDILFKQQVQSLEYEKGLDLAISICKKLYFDYEYFVSIEQWGDKDLLMDAILLCEIAKTSSVDSLRFKEMLPQVDAVTPDTEDFGDWHGSYALNAAASVSEMLRYILDRDILHVYYIGTYLTDTIDFKMQEKEYLPDELIDEHAMMIEARKFLLEQTNGRRTTSALQNQGFWTWAEDDIFIQQRDGSEAVGQWMPWLR